MADTSLIVAGIGAASLVTGFWGAHLGVFPVLSYADTYTDSWQWGKQLSMDPVFGCDSTTKVWDQLRLYCAIGMMSSSFNSPPPGTFNGIHLSWGPSAPAKWPALFPGVTVATTFGLTPFMISELMLVGGILSYVYVKRLL